jgi:hypothetical protein
MIDINSECADSPTALGPAKKNTPTRRPTRPEHGPQAGSANTPSNLRASPPRTALISLKMPFSRAPVVFTSPAASGPLIPVSCSTVSPAQLFQITGSGEQGLWLGRRRGTAACICDSPTNAAPETPRRDDEFQEFQAISTLQPSVCSAIHPFLLLPRRSFMRRRLVWRGPRRGRLGGR